MWRNLLPDTWAELEGLGGAEVSWTLLVKAHNGYEPSGTDTVTPDGADFKGFDPFKKRTIVGTAAQQCEYI